MKLYELEIQKTRGIPSLLLKPEGKNFVIWGPNGSGKSAVVDAIDFVLTGQISRLTGKGTGELSLSKHGPHIDYSPDEASVRAVLDLPGIGKAEIKRCLKNPNVFECEKTQKPALMLFTAIAQRGQHVLSRREILKYITADTSTRAQEIQELLNISEIEDTRKSLVTVRNELKRDVTSAKKLVDKAKGAANATVQKKAFKTEIVLKCVNDNRQILGGKDISNLHSNLLKERLRPPTGTIKQKDVNVTLLEKDIQNLIDLSTDENIEQISENDLKLRTLIDEIRAKPELLTDLSRAKLTKIGIGLIDETGNCPLCGTPWPPGKLKEYLENRMSSSEAAEKQLKEIESLSNKITEGINNVMASLQKIVVAAKLVSLEDEAKQLELWIEELQELFDALNNPLDKYPISRFNKNQVKFLLAPENYQEDLKRIKGEAKNKYPEATPEQTAWDILTRLEENLKSLEEAEGSFHEAELALKKGNHLHDSFLKARDRVLGKLYDRVRDRFVELYREIHVSDEGNFFAKIEPKEAGLKFEVDFYNRGTHPPHALHSEGHQDSMGISLYLALAEYLNKGIIDLIILDDVVMSVDSDHRRQVCRLLKGAFPDQQFIITTHDKTWANQLKSEGVVDAQSTVEFYNWNVNTGPQVNYGVDMWNQIENDLTKNDIPSAASKLRRSSEEFFGMVCDGIQATVPYKLNTRWELGDFLPAAKGKYRTLLKKAKTAAQSWGDRERFEMLNEVDSTVGQIYSRSGAEEWNLNANVHYNNWANFSMNDFRPVVDAYKDLFSLFICNKCGGMLSILEKSKKPVAVRCNCGKVDWNLIKKGE